MASSSGVTLENYNEALGIPSPDPVVPAKRKRTTTVSSRNRPPSSKQSVPQDGQQLNNNDPPATLESIHCICGFTYDDGFSIACDDCERWSHAICFDISQGAVPDEWKCWECLPRAVDREKANKLQKLRKKELEARYLRLQATNGLGLQGNPKRRRDRRVSINGPGLAGSTQGLPPGVRLGVNGGPNGVIEEEHIDIEDEWRSTYVPITEDIITHKSTRDKLRQHASGWRGVSALSPEPEGPNKITVVPVPSDGDDVSARVRPPAYALHTTEPIPETSFITNYTSKVIPSSAYLSDPLNAYAHWGMPKPFVHLIPPPLSVALDSRTTGNEARFARSGCKPNAVLRPILCQSKKRKYSTADHRRDSSDGTVPPIPNGDSSHVQESPSAGDDSQEKPPILNGNGTDGQRGLDIDGTDGTTDKVSFAIFALRDLKAKEEVILGWEWDDGSVVHELPALIEACANGRVAGPSHMTPQYLARLRLQMQDIIHSLHSTFTKCACGNNVRDCAVKFIESFVDSDSCLAAHVQKVSDQVSDLGPLIGNARGIRTRVVGGQNAGGLNGVQLVDDDGAELPFDKEFSPASVQSHDVPTTPGVGSGPHGSPFLISPTVPSTRLQLPLPKKRRGKPPGGKAVSFAEELQRPRDQVLHSPTYQGPPTPSILMTRGRSDAADDPLGMNVPPPEEPPAQPIQMTHALREQQLPLKMRKGWIRKSSEALKECSASKSPQRQPDPTLQASPPPAPPVEDPTLRPGFMPKGSLARLLNGFPSAVNLGPTTPESASHSAAPSASCSVASGPPFRLSPTPMSVSSLINPPSPVVSNSVLTHPQIPSALAPSQPLEATEAPEVTMRSLPVDGVPNEGAEIREGQIDYLDFVSQDMPPLVGRVADTSLPSTPMSVHDIAPLSPNVKRDVMSVADVMDVDAPDKVEFAEEPRLDEVSKRPQTEEVQAADLPLVSPGVLPAQSLSPSPSVQTPPPDSSPAVEDAPSRTHLETNEVPAEIGTETHEIPIVTGLERHASPPNAGCGAQTQGPITAPGAGAQEPPALLEIQALHPPMPEPEALPEQLPEGSEVKIEIEEHISVSPSASPTTEVPLEGHRSPPASGNEPPKIKRSLADYVQRKRKQREEEAAKAAMSPDTSVATASPVVSPSPLTLPPASTIGVEGIGLPPSISVVDAIDEAPHDVSQTGEQAAPSHEDIELVPPEVSVSVVSPSPKEQTPEPPSPKVEDSPFIPVKSTPIPPSSLLFQADAQDTHSPPQQLRRLPQSLASPTRRFAQTPPPPSYRRSDDRPPTSPSISRLPTRHIPVPVPIPKTAEEDGEITSTSPELAPRVPVMPRAGPHGPRPHTPPTQPRSFNSSELTRKQSPPPIYGRPPPRPNFHRGPGHPSPAGAGPSRPVPSAPRAHREFQSHGGPPRGPYAEMSRERDRDRRDRWDGDRSMPRPRPNWRPRPRMS